MAAVKMGEEDPMFVSLPDGRRIAYREQGLGKEMAKRSLLVLHGLGSSRVAGMPGKCRHHISPFAYLELSFNSKVFNLTFISKFQPLKF